MDLESRGMYYPCSENKGTDQLRSYCEADLRLCFRLCRLLGFPCCDSFYHCVLVDIDVSDESGNIKNLRDPHLQLKYANEVLEEREKLVLLKVERKWLYKF